MARIVPLAFTLLPVAAFAATATTTTLAITQNGNPVSSVAPHSTIQLVATVKRSGSGTPAGNVNFCNASGPHCTGVYLLGSAQVNAAGKATLAVPAEISVQSFTAVFTGNAVDAASTSSPLSLVVNGRYATTTTISSTQSGNTYALNATVTGSAAKGSPTGSVGFLDTTNGNNQVASGVLGAGTFTSSYAAGPVSTLAQNGSYQTPIVADFNGDGFPDFAVVEGSQAEGHAQAQFLDIYVFLNDGNGNFTQSYHVNSYPNHTSGTTYLYTADFNRDGYPDLAYWVDATSSLYVSLNKGDGTFATPTFSYNTKGNQPYIGDFNGDGLIDIILGPTGPTLLAGLGNGSFTAKTVTYSGGSYSASSFNVADLNGDGISDFVFNNQNNLYSLLGSASGNFTLVTTPLPKQLYASGIVGDYNNDGIPDVAISDTNTSNLYVFLGNGDGTFRTLAAQSVVNTGPYGSDYFVTTGDVNGDGNLDLVFATDTSLIQTGTEPHPTRVILGKGDGTFNPEADVHYNDTETDNSTILNEFVTDLNGDGLPDLFEVTLDGGKTYLDTSTSTASAIASYTPTAGSHAIDAMYNGDTFYAPSTSPTINIVGQGGTGDKTTTTVSVASASLANGASETISATVRDTTTASNTPAGTVTFYDTFNGSTTAVGTATVTGGTASTNYSSTTAGRHLITATYTPANANFSASADTTGKPVTVQLIAPTIQFTAPNTNYVQGQGYPLTATSNSPATIMFKVVSGPGTISGNYLYPSSAGNIVIQAYQAASGNYAAGSTNSTAYINKNKQTLNFTQPPTPVTNGTVITLQATASSGLPVTFTVLSGPGTIQNGNQLATTGTGTITVAAQQLGDTNYYASPRATYAVTVK